MRRRCGVFDKTANRFVAVIADNFGGMRMFSSPGWEADRLTWTSEVQSSKGKETQHFLFEKKSPHVYVVTYEVSRVEGQWKAVDTLTCSQK